MDNLDHLDIIKRTQKSGVRNAVRAALANIDAQTAAIERALAFENWKGMLGEENRAASYLDSLDKMRAALASVKGTPP